MVRPEYSGPALKVAHFDRSGHFGRSDRNVPLHSTKLLSPLPSTALLYPAYKNNNQTRGAGRLGSGLCNRKVPFHWERGISEISNRKIFVERKAPIVYTSGLKCLRGRICNTKRTKNLVNFFKPAIHKNRYVLHPRPKYTSSHKAWLCTTSGPRKQNGCFSC